MQFFMFIFCFIYPPVAFLLLLDPWAHPLTWFKTKISISLYLTLLFIKVKNSPRLSRRQCELCGRGARSQASLIRPVRAKFVWYWNSNEPWQLLNGSSVWANGQEERSHNRLKSDKNLYWQITAALPVLSAKSPRGNKYLFAFPSSWGPVCFV